MLKGSAEISPECWRMRRAAPTSQWRPVPVLTERALPGFRGAESELLLPKRSCSNDPQRLTGLATVRRRGASRNSTLSDYKLPRQAMVPKRTLDWSSAKSDYWLIPTV
jgi:hypothetical protein